MDNHRLATWCWKRHVNNKNGVYLFHIDQHWDDIGIYGKEIKKLEKFDLINSTLDEYQNLKLKYEKWDNDEMPLIRWDNYIGVFLKYFKIYKAMFVCHDESRGREEKTYPSNIAEFYELIQNIDYWIRKEKNVIINIDLDYFFINDGDETIECFSDKYIEKLFQKIFEINKSKKIKTITIALSPECCGGWNESFRILEIVKRSLKLDIDIK